MNEEEKKLQAYMDAINARSEMGEQASPDTSGAEDTEMAGKDFAANANAQYTQVSQAGAAEAADGAGQISQVGDATTSAGMMTGNPYVAAAGLAMKAVGSVDSAKRQQEQGKIDAYNKKIMAQRSAVRNLFA